MLREQVDEGGELALDLRQVRLLLERDVEQRAGVAGGGGSVRHDLRFVGCVGSAAACA